MKSVVLMKNIDEDDGQRRIIVCYGAHLHALFLDLNVKSLRRSPTAKMYSYIGL